MEFKLTKLREHMAVLDAEFKKAEEVGIDFMMEHCTLMHLFEFEYYGIIAEYCQKHGIQSVCDIGCAYGFQGEYFKEIGISYIGLDATGVPNPYSGVDSYQVGVYPCPIEHLTEDTLAVSVLALTWPCYTSKEEAIAQLYALKQDFTHALLYTPVSIDELALIFSEVRVVAGTDSFGQFIYLKS